MSGGNGEDKEAIHVAMQDEGGQVVLLFDRLVQAWVMDPQNAFEIAEGMARCAHAAKFGRQVQSDKSYLGQQILKRVTEEVRLRMIREADFSLTKMMEQNRKADFMAAEIVNRILSEVA